MFNATLTAEVISFILYYICFVLKVCYFTFDVKEIYAWSNTMLDTWARLPQKGVIVKAQSNGEFHHGLLCIYRSFLQINDIGNPNFDYMCTSSGPTCTRKEGWSLTGGCIACYALSASRAVFRVRSYSRSPNLFSLIDE